MDRSEQLGRCPLFAMLSPAELDFLGRLANPVRLAPGEAAVREGEPGDELFVVLEGELEVYASGADGIPKVLQRIGPFTHFGELSLIDHDVRSATVRARTEAQLLRWTAANLVSFRKHSKDGFTFVLINIVRQLSAVVRDANRRLAERI